MDGGVTVDGGVHRFDRKLELLAVLVMSLTAICTAWTGFQSSKWSGVMSISFSEAGANRTESVRQSNLASAQQNLDVGIFLAWVEAVAEDDTVRADFLFERFPDRLRDATTPWIALEPLTNADAPSSPFVMDTYVVEATAEADRLERAAQASSQAARDANQRSDNYVVTTILFASVLFFAALSGKLDHFRNRVLLLGLSIVGLVVGLIVVGMFPVEI